VTTRTFISVLISVLLLFSCDDSSTEEQNPDRITETHDEAPEIDIDQDGAVDGHSPLPTKEEMGKRVDEFWEKAPSKEDRLVYFDGLWTAIGSNYIFLSALEVDWDDVKERYRPEIEKAESSGRFFALLSRMLGEIHEVHTKFGSGEICRKSPERAPVFFQDSYSSTIGACVTVNENDEIVVYKVDSVNPGKLAPGDIILGYDGVTWQDLLEKIDEWEIPICGGHATYQRSQYYLRMESIVNNSHLFKKMNVKKYGTDMIEQVDSDQFQFYDSSITCNDQIGVTGVEAPFTDWSDFNQEADGADDITWGVLDGTEIGFIYIYSWNPGVADKFKEAVCELFETKALIIDQRFNMGGQLGTKPYPWESGLSLLLGEDVPPVMYSVLRNQSSEGYTDISNSFYIFDVDADEKTFYDKPIALLTGPKAGSCGDIFPYILSHHPTVKRFGRVTAGGFSGYAPYNSPVNDPFLNTLFVWYTNLVFVDSEQNLLPEKEELPENRVWLGREDAAKGRDTVLESALRWIEDSSD